MSTCLFCGGSGFSSSLYEDTLFNNKRFSYIKCRSCNLVQVDPLPTLDDYTAMYTMDYYEYKTHVPSPIYDKFFDDIKLIGNYTTFLDYGCGTGRHLVNAMSKGFKVTGTDFGNALIQKLSQSYPGAEFLEINDFYKKKDKYDVIFVSNVFEHLINPVEILNMLRDRLNPGGVLISEGPIEDNFTIAGNFRKLMFGFRKFILKKAVSHTPKHIFYSDYRNQLAYFERSKLKTIKYVALESAWPFPLVFKDAQGIKGKLFYVIGNFSVIADKAIPRSGNSFYYIGKKNT